MTLAEIPIYIPRAEVLQMDLLFADVLKPRQTWFSQTTAQTD